MTHRSSIDPRLALPALAILLALLLGAVETNAIVKTAGPNGEFEDPDELQDALDAVLAAGPGFHEVRIQGSFTAIGGLSVPSTYVQAALVLISGGWDSSFTTVIAGPESTRILGAAPVVSLQPRNEAVVGLANVRIEGGNAGSFAGGVLAITADSSEVGLFGIVVRGNMASANTEGDSLPMQLSAGGLYARAEEGGFIVVADSLFDDNRLETNAPLHLSGAGAAIDAVGNGRIDIVDSRFTGNNCAGPSGGQAFGCAISATATDSATIIVRNNLFSDNSVDDLALVEGVHGFFACDGSATIEESRNRFLRGSSPAASVSVSARAEDQCIFSSQSSLVAQGPGIGYRARTSSNSEQIHFSNLTAADNASRGVEFINGIGTTTMTFGNSIIFGNGLDSAPNGATSLLANLTGTDPHFMAPAAGNYSPKPGSPAIDAGTDSVPGGLSELDIEGRPRVAASPGLALRTNVPQVDIGAWEGPFALFYGGFESGDTSEWSTTQP